MRKWHRWLSAIFGAFLLFIATTGVMSHFAAIVAEGEAPPASAAPAGFVCPESMTCRPKPSPDSARAWVGFMHHLHSGEEFGPIGTVIAILSGLAMIFFALSGLWMYLRMWSARRRAAKSGLFWS